jgi:hypothetical protein
MARAPRTIVTVGADSDTAVALREALGASVPDLHRLCRDPWAVIGSGAAWLAGASVTVADLDVLTSTRDAETLIDHWRARLATTTAATGAERFRSRFARFLFPGLAVEIMGGLEVSGDGGWEPVALGEIVTADVAGLRVPIPAVHEQIRVLESFDRPKDRQRAALLKSLREETL